MSGCVFHFRKDATEMKMKKEDRIRVYGGLEELRLKQVSTGLSNQEERQLNAMLDEAAEKDIPDIREFQWNSPVDIIAFRNASFIEEPVKRSLLDRLLQREMPEFFSLDVPNEEDFTGHQWPLPFALEVRKFIEGAGLDVEWEKVLPVSIHMDMWEGFGRDELNWFKQLPEPYWCHMKMTEVDDLEEKAAAHSEEMLEAIRWLKEHWKEGYQIYLDITEIFYF